MSAKNKKGKESFGSSFKERMNRIKLAFKHNLIWIRTIQLIVCFVLIFGGLGYGWLNAKAKQKERAMTVSDIDQEIFFSITETPVKLHEQYINGNTVVIPFTLGDISNMSSDASNYTLHIVRADEKPLPEDASAVMSFFGSTGDGAIIISGSFEPGPVQIFIRDKAEYGIDEEETGLLRVGAFEVEVDYNAVTFTSNLRADNLIEDELVSPTMSYKDLYYVSFGQKVLAQIDKDEKDLETVYENTQQLKKEYENRLRSFNLSLGLPDGDREPIRDVGGKRNYDRSQIEEYAKNKDGESTELSDLSNADIRTARNVVISELDSIDERLVSNEEAREDLKATRENTLRLIEDMNSIITLSDIYTIEDFE